MQGEGSLKMYWQAQVPHYGHLGDAWLVVVATCTVGPVAPACNCLPYGSRQGTLHKSQMCLKTHAPGSMHFSLYQDMHIMVDRYFLVGGNWCGWVGRRGRSEGAIPCA